MSYEPLCLHKKEHAINSAGIDLHNKSISICTVDPQRRILDRRRFLCCEAERIAQYFTDLGEFQAVIEAAWRLVSKTRRWRALFEPPAKRRGRKKAIVAIARRLLCMMTAMLKNGQPYRYAA